MHPTLEFARGFDNRRQNYTELRPDAPLSVVAILSAFLTLIVGRAFKGDR